MINLEKIENFAQFIENVAQTFSNRTAFKYRPKFRVMNFTFEEIYKLACSCAQILKNAGCKKGDNVLIWANNSPFWVAGFFGIQLTGAVAVPLNPGSKSDFIKKVAKATVAKFLLKSALFLVPHGLNLKFLDLEKLEKDPKFVLPKIKINENDLAEIVYTSGTTGFPKGVMLTHKNILSNLKSVLAKITLTEKDRGLSILPLSHMFEQVAGMLAPMAVGAQITYPGAVNSVNIAKNLVEDKITKMAAVPEFLRLIIRRLEEKAEQEGGKPLLDLIFKIGEKTPTMNLRRLLFHPILKRFGGELNTIFSGGAPLDSAIGRKWEAMGIYILQGYGTTEASPVISANSYPGRKIDSVGKLIPGVEVKISKDGEILVRGENIFRGYYQDTKKTKKAFENGWLKTGDLGFFDRNGHLHILGRKKYMIVTEAGENVYPEDLEAELNKFPQVEDSCVVGLKLGEKQIIHAVLLGKGISNPQNIIAQVNQKMANYQQIQDFSIWAFADFPRTVTKKVKRDEVIKFLQTRKIEAEELLPTSAGLVEKIISKITSLSTSQITSNKKLVEDLKMDSLERVELVSAIEEETGIIIDEAEIGPGTTVADVKEKVEHQILKTEIYKFQEWPLTSAILLLRKFAQKLVLFPLVSYFVNLDVAGVENLANLPLPAIFYSNHISAVDPVIIVKSLPERIRRKLAVAAASDVIYEDPKYRKYQGLLTFFFNIFPFSRIGQIKSSLEYTGRLLDRDFSILAFPEGRVSTTGKIQTFKPGAGFLAVEMQVNIVPIKISGIQEIVPPGTQFPFWPKRGKAKVKIGKFLNFPANTPYFEATEKIEKVIKNLI